VQGASHSVSQLDLSEQQPTWGTSKGTTEHYLQPLVGTQQLCIHSRFLPGDIEADVCDIGVYIGAELPDGRILEE
jgi:hypothetical protein